MSASMGIRKGADRLAERTELLHGNEAFTARWSLGFSLAFLLLLMAAGRAFGQQTSPSSKGPAEFQEAEALMQQGHLDEAKAKVQEELQHNPSSVDGYNLLGIIESAQQDYTGAIETLQHALKIAPNATKTHNNLGNVYVAEKQPELAENEFRTVLRLDPANADGNYNLGVLLMAKGAAAEAIPHLERVRPPNVATSLNLVRAYLQTKHTAEALRLATELSTQHKDDIQVHFSLGVTLAAEKQFKAAELELEKADALEPGAFEVLYNLGRSYLLDGDYAKAQLALGRALKLRPESPEALFLQAQALNDQGKPLDALDLLVRAHKIAPQNTDIIYLMAQVSISQNYFEDAIPLLEAGLGIAPQRTDLLASLGESYFMAGKVDKALDVFQRLIAAEHSARSYAYVGISYRELGRFDEAKGYFEQGLKVDPHNNVCLFNLGLIAERQGDNAAAEARFQQVLHATPDYSEALLELANLRIGEKKFAEAEELLKRYVKVSRHPATGYYKLAMVERSLHETAAADRDLNVFQTLSKNASGGAFPYEHLYDYLDSRSKLAPAPVLNWTSPN